MAHAWKACWGQPLKSSNLLSSASLTRHYDALLGACHRDSSCLVSMLVHQKDFSSPLTSGYSAAGLSSGFVRRSSKTAEEARTRPQLQVTDSADLPRTHPQA